MFTRMIASSALRRGATHTPPTFPFLRNFSTTGRLHKDLRSAVQDLQYDVESLRTDFQSIKHDLTDVLADVTDVRADIKVIKSGIDTLKSELMLAIEKKETHNTERYHQLAENVHENNSRGWRMLQKDHNQQWQTLHKENNQQW